MVQVASQMRLPAAIVPCKKRMQSCRGADAGKEDEQGTYLDRAASGFDCCDELQSWQSACLRRLPPIIAHQRFQNADALDRSKPASGEINESPLSAPTTDQFASCCFLLLHRSHRSLVVKVMLRPEGPGLARYVPP